MSSKYTSCYELTKFMPNHIFSYVYRYMFSSIMNCYCK